MIFHSMTVKSLRILLSFFTLPWSLVHNTLHQSSFIIMLAVDCSTHLDNADRFYDNKLPRWNFTDTFHSFMIVIRALCGEWVESYFDCAVVNGASSIIYFCFMTLFGSFIVSYIKIYLHLMKITAKS